MEPLIVTIAKGAYYAYGSVTDHKNYQGLPMPEWIDLPPKIQQAWVKAAEYIREYDSNQNQPKAIPENHILVKAVDGTSRVIPIDDNT